MGAHAMLAGFVIAIVNVFGTIDVAITTSDDRTIEGTIDVDELTMKTSFGSARIDVDRLASIEFSKPHVVVADDQTVMRGELALTSLSVRSAQGESSLRVEDLKSLIVIKRAALKPGEVTEGVAKNKMTYCLRAPSG